MTVIIIVTVFIIALFAFNFILRRLKASKVSSSPEAQPPRLPEKIRVLISRKFLIP